MYNLKVKGFFRILFPRFWKNVSLPYFTFHNGYWVFSETDSLLSQFIHEDTRLREAALWQSAATHIPAYQNILGFYNHQKGRKLLFHWASTEFQEELQEESAFYKEIEFVSWGVTNDGTNINFYFNVRVRSAP